MTEHLLQPHPVIETPSLDDVEGYRRVQARGWLDAYPNEDAGVPLEWVEQETSSWLTPEALKSSRERVQSILDDPQRRFLYVAKVEGKPVGMVHTTAVDGNQRLEAVYVDKEFHGTGLAQELFDTAMAHLSPDLPVTLEVIAYNERAQRFYKKNGFEIVPGSEHFYKGIMPSIVMVRPAGVTHEV